MRESSYWKNPFRSRDDVFEKRGGSVGWSGRHDRSTTEQSLHHDNKLEYLKPTRAERGVLTGIYKQQSLELTDFEILLGLTK
jgi:hypothetical protein